MKIRRYRPENKIKPLISKAVEDIDPEHYSQEQQRHLEEVIPEMNKEFAEKDRYNYFIAIENNEIIGVEVSQRVPDVMNMMTESDFIFALKQNKEIQEEDEDKDL